MVEIENVLKRKNAWLDHIVWIIQFGVGRALNCFLRANTKSIVKNYSNYMLY